VAADVTHCLRREMVLSSAAEIHAGLSALIQNAALLQKFIHERWQWTSPIVCGVKWCHPLLQKFMQACLP